MKKYLYLAEKPSTMNEVKKIYEKNKSLIGYEIDFLSLAGHVCGLKEPKEYDEWSGRWADISLPMIPQRFSVKATNKEIISRVKAALKSSAYDALIVGTDSDVEGNGIFDLLENYLGLSKYPALRFFETDLTEEGIMRSFRNMSDYRTNPRDIGMTEAFRIRSRFDWLIGFNLSVAWSVNSGITMRVGRVKAPTIKLVYDNSKEIDSFNPESSFQPYITLSNGVSAGYIDEEENVISFSDREKASKVLEETGSSAAVKKIEEKEAKRLPPQFYKLSDVQVDAGSKYGYSPERTLDIMQTLYEKHHILSYPRTDGRFISSERADDIEALVDAALTVPGLDNATRKIIMANVPGLRNNKRYVNDEEVAKSSHDALIPTGNEPDWGALSQEEVNVCSLIYRRFLQAFLPALKEVKTKAVFTSEGKDFIAKGSRIIDPGFTVLLENKPKEINLPEMNEGGIFEIDQKYVKEVVSKPPKRLTQATLIAAMENIQKYMQKGELKDIMKEAKGIGQPSSRASIISDLLGSGYMCEKKDGLHITDKGCAYVENMNGSRILDPELSAEWERHIVYIKNRKETFHEAYSHILEYLNQSLEEIRKMDFTNKVENGLDFDCPVCSSPMKKINKGYGCSAYPGCRFAIWETVAGKRLTELQIKMLCKQGKTGIIKGFKAKSGKLFDAELKLESDGSVVFSFPKPEEHDLDFKCPVCGSMMKKNKVGYGCSNYPDCSFVIWHQIAGREISEREAMEFCTKKETEVLYGFKSKAGKDFDAALFLEDGKVKFKFD